MTDGNGDNPEYKSPSLADQNLASEVERHRFEHARKRSTWQRVRSSTFAPGLPRQGFGRSHQGLSESDDMKS